jgi:hypothetical protein
MRQEVQGVSGSLQSLEKRTFRWEDLLNRLETRVTKASADVDYLKGSVASLKVSHNVRMKWPHGTPG